MLIKGRYERQNVYCELSFIIRYAFFLRKRTLSSLWCSFGVVSLEQLLFCSWSRTGSASLDRFRLFGPDPAKKGGSASLDRIRLFGPDTAKKGGSATLCDSKYLNYSAQLTDTEVTRVRIRHVSQGKNSEDRQSHCVQILKNLEEEKKSPHGKQQSWTGSGAVINQHFDRAGAAPPHCSGGNFRGISNCITQFFIILFLLRILYKNFF